MTDLQGAIGVVQIKKLKNLIAERQKWARYYIEGLRGVSWLAMPHNAGGADHALQAFVTRVDPEVAPFQRNEIMDKLLELGISTRPGTHAVHLLGYYSGKFGFKPEDFPNATLSDRQTIALPLHNKMSKDDFDYIITAVNSL
jgi:dTDP-4-amino-4,6-dideoxygalactose transaminase